MSGFRSWYDDFEFTDEQWRKILKPLKKTSISSVHRMLLERYARQHGELRARPRFVRGQTRKSLERISKLAAQLRSEIVGTEDTFLDVELANAKFSGLESFGEMNGFFPAIRDLELMERRANELSKFLRGRNEKPGNVDDIRNYTLERLVWIYELISGKPARAHVGTDSSGDGTLAGKAIGPFVEFVQAFMSAIPNEPKPTGDQIKWFLDQRKKHGKRASKKM